MVTRAASVGSIPTVQRMPSMVHKCTGDCNRVLPRADLGMAARVGQGHSFRVSLRGVWAWGESVWESSSPPA